MSVPWSKVLEKLNWFKLSIKDWEVGLKLPEGLQQQTTEEGWSDCNYQNEDVSLIKSVYNNDNSSSSKKLK